MPDPTNAKPENREDQVVEIENLQITLSPWPRLAKTWKSIVALSLILLFLGWALYLFKDRMSFSITKSPFQVYTVDPSATSIQPDKINSYQICFWTPSPETRSTNWNDSNSWQTNSSVARQLEFGAILKEGLHVSGYRRSAVFGQGQHNPKDGFWWTVTVTTNITVRDVVIAYKSFWKPKESVYIETIGDTHPSRN